MAESIEARFWHKVPLRPTNGCWLWTGHIGPKGYGTFRVGAKVRRAHVVAWGLAHGVPPDGRTVRHTCDNPPCVRPGHLVAGTQADNVRDMDERGRRGKRGLHKLTEHAVAHIQNAYVPRSRARDGNGTSAKELAERYGVTTGYISLLAKRPVIF